MFLAMVAGGYGQHTMQFFFTGALAMVILFTSIFSAFSLIEDRTQGFLQGVLVSPAASWEIVLGKVLGGTLLATFQALLFLALAPILGIPLHPLIVPVLFLSSFALSSLGLAMAWPSTSIGGFHAVISLVQMPMWLLSGAIFPAAGAHPVVQLAMQLNPFTYVVSSLRGPQVSYHGLIAFALISFALALGVAHTQRQGVNHA
jgi:ABC-2 type transport system permease protein